MTFISYLYLRSLYFEPYVMVILILHLASSEWMFISDEMKISWIDATVYVWFFKECQIFCSWQPCDHHPHIGSHCLIPWYWHALLPVEIPVASLAFFLSSCLYSRQSLKEGSYFLRQLWVSRVGNWATSPIPPHHLVCFWERVSLNVLGYPQSFQPSVSECWGIGMYHLTQWRLIVF